MKTVICTLFERKYHLGAAVLANSLCHAGYTGPIFAGFRGPLPLWAESQVKAVAPGRWEMPVSPEIHFVFLELRTPAHFTNYKPDFLLQIETLARQECDAVIYCDPDIVINNSWRYVEEWLSCGVALCEDVNSPLHQNNPRRVGWERFFQPFGYSLKFRGDQYANGGFLGLEWKYRDLLLTWQALLVHIADALGGSDVVGIDGGRMLEGNYGFADCFHQPDQDALNAALEVHPEIPTSFLGPAAMGFQGGHALFPHALGREKPWDRRYLNEAFGGIPPRQVDKSFWQYAGEPLQPFSKGHVSARRMQLAFASAMGRVMRRI